MCVACSDTGKWQAPRLMIATMPGRAVLGTPAVQVNGGFEPDADVGPVITPEAKARCEKLIQSGIDQV